MNLILKSANYDIPTEIRARVEAKFGTIEKLLGEADSTALCEVELARVNEHQRSGEIYYAEANVDTGGKLIRATAQAETMEAAIDTVEAELTRELRRAKRKSRSLMRRTGSAMKSWFRN